MKSDLNCLHPDKRRGGAGEEEEGGNICIEGGGGGAGEEERNAGAAAAGGRGPREGAGARVGQQHCLGRLHGHLSQPALPARQRL